MDLRWVTPPLQGSSVIPQWLHWDVEDTHTQTSYPPPIFQGKGLQSKRTDIVIEERPTLLPAPPWKWESTEQNRVSSFQFSSVACLCPTLCDPMNHSTPGLPVHHQLLEFTQTHAHRVSDVIQASHPLSSPSPPAPNPSQHQGRFQRVNSSHQVAKVLEFQLQHQSFQWTPRTDLL